MASRAKGGRAAPARTARPLDDDTPGSAAARLTREQQLELYYWMRLTRTLEERLVALYRQTKVVGGLFRSLGQEADAVGSCFALEQRDVMSPLIRNLGAMLVKGATPVEVLKQYMAKGDSPTRGRELNIHFGDVGAAGKTRGFLGQISPLGDMVPVMAGVTLSFRMRGEDRVGLVYVGDGATSTGAFHEGINFAAVQRCPLVVVIENNGYAYSTPTSKQTLAKSFVDKAIGYGIPGERADGNDVLAVYDVTKRAVDRARRGEGVSLIELMTYRRKGHAEHDNQSYVPEGEIERWARENDPLDRYLARLTTELGFDPKELAAVDERVRREVDAATDVAEASPFPEPLDALAGVYADPPAARPLWYREGISGAVTSSERAADGWGVYKADAKQESKISQEDA
ncbi:MAG TPA: thiamine pyrophosphate-dependent dehydrogenase E1 component subunit alpha [Gemmatimonadaceae bacterium]